MSIEEIKQDVVTGVTRAKSDLNEIDAKFQADKLAAEQAARKFVNKQQSWAKKHQLWLELAGACLIVALIWWAVRHIK